MDAALKRARFSVLAAFFINGAAVATWVSRIPAVQEKLALSEAELGLVLLGMSVGVLVALSLAGGLLARFGSAKVTLIGGLFVSGLLVLPGLAPNSAALWLALFAFGAAISLMDVAMNDQAVLVERGAGRPLMSSFHATYSVGGLAGALFGSGMAGAGTVTPFLHFGIAAVVLAAATLFSSHNLIPTKPQTEEKPATFRLPERALWLLGAVAFCSSIGEGAMADWSGVYLSEVMGATAALAALGYAAFSLTMTVGRFLGDTILAHLRAEMVVRVGGLLAALGLALIVLTDSPGLALVGFGLVGIGLANIIPVAFSSAGNFPGISSGAGIAGVATIGYAGFLAGPPVIGLVAEATSLRLAFVLVALAVGSLVFTARGVGNKG